MRSMPTCVTAWNERPRPFVASIIPNCVRYLKAGARRGQPYIITEFVDGEELGVWASRGRSLGELLSVCAQIADCLAHTHRSGVVHRDLKPANVLVLPEGAVKVIDFGISKIIGRQGDITKTGEGGWHCGIHESGAAPRRTRRTCDRPVCFGHDDVRTAGRPATIRRTHRTRRLDGSPERPGAVDVGPGTVRRRATGVPFAREGRRGPLRIDG